MLRCWAGVGTVGSTWGLHLASKDMGHGAHVPRPVCTVYSQHQGGRYIHREVPGLLQGRGTPEGAQGPPVPTVRSTQCLHPESAPSLTNCPNGHSLNRGQPPVFRVIEVSQTTLWALRTALQLQAAFAATRIRRAPVFLQRYRTLAACTLYLPGAQLRGTVRAVAEIWGLWVRGYMST